MLKVETSTEDIVFYYNKQVIHLYLLLFSQYTKLLQFMVLEKCDNPIYAIFS